MAKTNPLLFLALLSLLLTGCAAQRPVLYPNERLVSSGRDVAEMEINRCLRDAAPFTVHAVLGEPLRLDGAKRSRPHVQCDVCDLVPRGREVTY